MRLQKYNLKYLVPALCVALALVFIWGCSPTRRLNQNGRKGERLLNKVTIEADNKSVDKSEAEDYLRQKPNRKLLGVWRLYLQIYNSVNPEKASRAHIKKTLRKQKRIDKRSNRRAKRCAKRPKDRPCKPLPDTTNVAKTFREWVQGIGEPAVVYDSSLTKTSSSQIAQYLFNSGYFYATVKDSSAQHKKKEDQVDVFFKIKSGPRYRVDTVIYQAEDSLLQRIINGDKEEKLFKQRRYFNADNIGKERDRLTQLFRNKGYFFFNNEYIVVKADSVNRKQDTVRGAPAITLTFIIKNPEVVDENNPDSTTVGKHYKYKIRSITVNTEYSASITDYSRYRVEVYDTMKFLYSDTSHIFRPKALYNHIFIRRNEVYTDENMQATLSRLGELRVFKFVNMQFAPTDSIVGDTMGFLDCTILLTPAMRRAFTVETQGTNTNGALGIGGAFSFLNKNLFKGAEYFDLRIRGALEFQKLVDETSADSASQSLFNTREFGASLSLNLPRATFPLHYFVKGQIKNPKTVISTAFNYQDRFNRYSRNIYTLTYGWNWKQTRRLLIQYNPVELNIVNTDLKPPYLNELNSSNNTVLINSFNPQLIDAGKVTFIWSNQVPNKRTRYIYWRSSLETAGNILSLFGKTVPDPTTPDENYKSIFNGIRTSQYVKGDFEIYPNFYFNQRNAIATRFYVGLAYAYGNSYTMPFEKSFYGGGSNGMRAWVQRSLGPGVFLKDQTFNPDQIGDIKIEANIEYRLKLISVLEPALFVDIGNIWITQDKDSSRPGGVFKPSQFYKQFGVGYGVGLRFDFSFFLLRLDFARRLVDPGQQYGSHVYNPFEYKKNYWTNPNEPDPAKWEYKYSNPIVFNLGIGYPF